MKYKIFLTFFVLLFIVSPNSINAHSERAKLLQEMEILKQEISLLKKLISNMQSEKEIEALSYLVFDLSDNSIILEKNSTQPYPIASITKLMTAVIVRENINEKKRITLKKKMLKPEGRSPALFPGRKIKAENLLKACLIQSSNDAAEALSYFLGKETFLGLMNEKGEELGMTNTVFYDPHGLSPNNISTAQDIVKLLTYIYQKHPEILTITRDNNFWLSDRKGKLVKFRNTNNFYPLSNFIGGKTGYLPEAKQTFAGIFNVNEKPIAIVVLYSPNRQADTFSLLKALKNNQEKTTGEVNE